MNQVIDNIQKEKKMLSSFDVIDMNSDIFVKNYLEDNDISLLDGNEIVMKDVLSSIEDINLAYFDPCLKDIGDKLIGVWVIKTKKALYAFDVYDGTLVYKNN